MSKDVKRAPVTPCHECPWRVSNQGLPVPQKYDGAYGRTERAAQWSAVRDGNYVSTCHLSLADREMFPHGGDPEWIAAGYQAVPEHAEKRECAGAVAAALREMRLLAAAGSWDEYHRQRPQGLSKDAATLWAARIQGHAVPGRPTLRKVVVDDRDIIEPATDDGFSDLDLVPPKQYRQVVELVEWAARQGLLPSAGAGGQTA
ncbi:hypothetical protein [Blastococcus saxobsidens]|uniref:Uncharacterized protein n=1 Tax=Blastococcus saxobsidens TaxID=138336 RepID=A0A4Q7Y8R5_9ACTN|nr:hypothetical protein [Blastococcus saxobsidens]RZU32703.1 hypothetical protein BKA19_2404 [Blastococcus saxobsidens]